MFCRRTRSLVFSYNIDGGGGGVTGITKRVSWSTGCPRVLMINKPRLVGPEIISSAAVGAPFDVDCRAIFFFFFNRNINIRENISRY